jgi:hypothetical protein
MAKTTSKQLIDIKVIPAYNSDTNVVKSVNYKIIVFDDVIGQNQNTVVELLQQSVLSSEDLAAENYITIDGTTTQTEIINWAHTNLGGDEAAADMISYAETKLDEKLYLLDGTADYDFSTNPA